MKDLLTFLSLTLLSLSLALPAKADGFTFRDAGYEYNSVYTLEDYDAPDELWVVFTYNEADQTCYSGWAEADAASVAAGRQSLSQAFTGLPEWNNGIPTVFYQVDWVMNPHDAREPFFSEWYAMTPRGVCIVQFAVDTRLMPGVADAVPEDGGPEPEGDDA